MDRLRVSALALATLLLVPASCDDDEGDSGGDGPEPASSGEEDSGSSPGADACVDGDVSTPVGETRACECMDGSQSTQTCLATGEFGVCDCAGW